MGFGTDAKGVKAFVASGSLIGDLGSSYLSPVVGDIVTIGATISAIACCLACVVGASRLVFALSRDGLGPAALGVVSEKHAVPSRAVGAVTIAVYAAIALTWIIGATPTDLFAQSGTAGTLILLVVYALATVGAIKLLFFTGERKVAIWEVVIPVLAILVVAYTLFRNIIPLPTGAYWWGPGLSIAWLVVAGAAVLARKAAAERAGRLLAEAEGLSAPTD